jgi:hypothetical protein
MRCENCGGEVEAGRNFCPHCGKPVAAGGASAEAGAAGTATAGPQTALQPLDAGRERAEAAEPLRADAPTPMASFGKPREEEPDDTRRKVYIGVALLAALLVAGVVYLATRPKAPVVEPRLEGALRAGSPEFDQARSQVVVEFDPDEDATESPRGIGDIIMTMTPKVRNLSNRTVTGLELHAAVVDLDGNPVKEKTVVPVPGRQPELAPYKVLDVPITIEGFKPGDVRANIRVTLTGVKFK